MPARATRSSTPPSIKPSSSDAPAARAMTLFDSETFQSRHIGPDEAERDQMLKVVGAPSLDALIDEAIPPRIRLKAPLDVPAGITECQFLRDLRRTASRNQLFRSFIGLGYYDTITPSVILRNVLENPGWYAVRPTRPRSPRAGSNRCSISRRWSAI